MRDLQKTVVSEAMTQDQTLGKIQSREFLGIVGS
jgi:hypothetical protein